MSISGSWVIVDNQVLAINSDAGSLFVPSANDIYNTEFKNKEIKGFSIGKPTDQLIELKMSKYPLDLKLIIRYGKNAEIDTEIVVIHDQQKIKTPLFDDQKCDHIIIEGTWYPFVQGGMEEIEQVLEQAGINNSSLTLRQYVNLRQLESPIIIDEVTSFPLDKASTLENSGVTDIPGFVGKLYPYQTQGYLWLKMITEQEAGCILADEMGLGKTAQIIALLTSEVKNGEKHFLIIAPVSLLENWRREFLKFSPDLRVAVHQGVRRTGFYTELLKFDVIVTSYETILRDLSLFEMIEWNVVVTDEAQAIKNPYAKRTLALKQLPRKTSIAVTGTPIENRLIDIWSLADFSFPGFLGDIKQFEDKYPNEVEGAESLEPVISPIMLRRRVRDVANDLPDRIEIPQIMKLNESQIDAYETIRQQVLDEYGRNASLVALIKLRMYCTHPFLQEEEGEDPTCFIKYQRMVEIIEEILVQREKIIIFTSYTGMADIMVRDLSKRFNIESDFIDGRVNVEERQPKIDRFSSIEGSAILVLNPRAAGVGLNITAANHVIHYNLEWNPALEDQASARAHRRGQTRPVNVYRLYIADTVEEIINDRLERKRLLSSSAVVGTDGTSDSVDIIQALTKTPLRRVAD